MVWRTAPPRQTERSAAAESVAGWVTVHSAVTAGPANHTTNIVINMNYVYVIIVDKKMAFALSNGYEALPPQKHLLKSYQANCL